MIEMWPERKPGNPITRCHDTQAWWPTKEREVVICAMQMLVRRGHRLLVPNTKLFQEWESDLISVQRSGYIAEFEIKTSRADFLADLRKPRHSFYANNPLYGPSRFTYVAPAGVIEAHELPAYAGLWEYETIWRRHGFWNWDVIECEKPTMRNRNRFTHQQLERLAASLSWRFMREFVDGYARPDPADLSRGTDPARV